MASPLAMTRSAMAALTGPAVHATCAPGDSHPLSIKQHALAYLSDISYDQGNKFNVALELKKALAALHQDGYFNPATLPADLNPKSTPKGAHGLLILEYLIYHLNRHVELALNPFLSHWCEAHAFYRSVFFHVCGPENFQNVAHKFSDAGGRLRMAHWALVKAILLNDGPYLEYMINVPIEDLVDMQDPEEYPSLHQPAFYVADFLSATAPPSSRIWRDANELQTFKDSIESLVPHLKQTPLTDGRVLRSQPGDLTSATDFIYRFVSNVTESQRMGMLNLLPRLPIDDIKNLELINGLLARAHDPSSKANGWDYDWSSLIRDFVQNGLRRVEKLGRSDGDAASQSENRHPRERAFGRGDATESLDDALADMIGNFIELGIGLGASVSDATSPSKENLRKNVRDAETGHEEPPQHDDDDDDDDDALEDCIADRDRRLGVFAELVAMAEKLTRAMVGARCKADTPSQSPSRSLAPGAPDSTMDRARRRSPSPDAMPTHDREAQKRAVRLLCLFLRNALLRRWVALGEVLFEVREVGMQYVWVPEARELRREYLKE